MLHRKRYYAGRRWKNGSHAIGPIVAMLDANNAPTVARSIDDLTVYRLLDGEIYKVMIRPTTKVYDGPDIVDYDPSEIHVYDYHEWVNSHNPTETSV